MATRAPHRPDEAPSQRRLERRWLPALAVVGVIVFVTGGAQAVGDALAGPPGPPVDVGGAVRVQPEPGWELEGQDADAALLVRGTARLFIQARTGTTITAVDLARSYVEDDATGLRARFSRLTVEDPPEEVVAANGLPGLRFGYVGETKDGASVEGVVTVVVSPTGSAVIFDGFATMGDLAWAVDDLRTMVDGAVVA